MQDLPISQMNEHLIKLSHSLLPTEVMREILTRCVEEDGGFEGDITTRSIIPQESRGRFAINVRGRGVLAGLEPMLRAIDVYDSLALTNYFQDGEEVVDATIACLDGSVQTALIAERTILNVLGHACGIATLTKQFVDAVDGTECIVCDTRKTTPGLRSLDKYSVACGGGVVHRLGLHDAALYKDNHIARLDYDILKLQDAIGVVRRDDSLQFVEVEVDSLEQLEEALLLDVDILLLDNFGLSDLEQAVAYRDKAERSPLLEASGGITIDTVSDVASTGVDRVAVGALTHSAPWIDIGLDVIDE